MRLLSFGHDPDARLLPPRKRDAVSFGHAGDYAHTVSVGDLDSPEEAKAKLFAAADKAKASVTAKEAALKEEFGRPMGAARLFEITDAAWRITTEMLRLAREVDPSDFKKERREIEGAAVRLLELRSLARVLRDKPASLPEIALPLPPGSKWSVEYSSLVTFPHRMTKHEIDLAVDRRGKMLDIVDIPSKTLEYIGKQARRGLEGLTGIPEWAIPVAIVAALGLVAYNYGSRTASAAGLEMYPASGGKRPA